MVSKIGGKVKKELPSCLIPSLGRVGFVVWMKRDQRTMVVIGELRDGFGE